MARRRLALLGCLSVLLMAGCSPAPPPGTDGDLGNDWNALAAPFEYRPKVGTCITGSIAYRHSKSVVDCTKLHQAQVVGVGEFSAAGATPEQVDDAYAYCDQKARAFLKEDWRPLLLTLDLVRSRTATAKDGARWWECTLSFMNIGEINEAVKYYDLTDGIPAELRMPCVTYTKSNGSIQGPVDCAKPHNAEYAGSTTLPPGTAFPTSPSTWSPLQDACSELVGAYVGVDPAQAEYLSWPSQREADWPTNPMVRCYVYLKDNMTGSARGTGGKGVPW